jgi:phosphoglycerol transferase MdoB-like AlkP superfamily enzyme
MFKKLILKIIIPTYIKKFIFKFSIFILVFSVCRIVFFAFNKSQFPNVEGSDFLVGILFDVVTTAIIFIPIVIIELFPNMWRASKVFKLITGFLFFSTLLFSILLNIADVAYFQFTTSRITQSTFTMLGFGNDLEQQLPSFLKDYWFLFAITILLMALSVFLYNKVSKIKDDSKQHSWGKQTILFSIGAVLILFMGRGTGLRPIEPINTTAFVQDEKVNLVLNSAFTVVKSWGRASLEQKEYFEDLELKTIFNPIHSFKPGLKQLNKPNIVILLLESFSVEYIAAINGSSEINTPFLDSLIQESLVYTNCYANGKKSLDAVPSVISSLPKLMEQEFITSNYATNTIESLPKILNKLGYESAFFHGATNGSMNFDQFSNKVEFDTYFGRTEYNNETDFDGTWGIYDDKFFKWSAQQMSKMKTPFFSTIFSLSSHPPYSIPEEYKNAFVGGETKMHNSVKYTDFGLQQFFKFAKTQDWYTNTVFIITADHTPASKVPEYYKEIGGMHIPLVFFHPNNSTFKGVDDQVVGQIDIMPTVLELIGYKGSYFGFGSPINDKEAHFSVTYYNNKHIIFGLGHVLFLQNESVIGLYALDDKMQNKNLQFEKVDLAKHLENNLKAYIQTYNESLINNKMTAD